MSDSDCYDAMSDSEYGGEYLDEGEAGDSRKKSACLWTVIERDTLPELQVRQLFTPTCGLACMPSLRAASPGHAQHMPATNSAVACWQLEILAVAPS